ncbi:MAG: RIP metalloprotease RseP [Candidatus Eisenbacteria bacterium]
MVLSTILPGLLLLGIVIFVHELGHFLAAKARGVTVLKFSLGMGPEMIGFTHGGTRYCFSWVPLGGFVQMAGDHLEEDGTMPEGGPEGFLTHPWPGRVLIAIAGPFANLVLAFVTFCTLYMVGITMPDYPNVMGSLADSTAAYQAGLREGDVVMRLAGKPVKTWRGLEDAFGERDTSRALVFELRRAGSPLELEVPAAQALAVARTLEPPANPPVIGAVMSGLPAYQGGLQEGDRILAIDGMAIQRFTQVSEALHGKAGKRVVFHVQRSGGARDVTVTPMKDEQNKDAQRALIGIEPPRTMTSTFKLGFSEAVKAGAMQTLATTGQVYAGLFTTLTRFWQVKEQMGGPVFIAQMARDAARKGFDYWLNLMGMINLAIMSFNLLPVPLLDGGHITMALIEAVRRRGISGRTYLRFQQVGLVVVGTLFVFILSQDILRPIRRMRALDQAHQETTKVAPAQATPR